MFAILCKTTVCINSSKKSGSTAVVRVHSSFQPNTKYAQFTLGQLRTSAVVPNVGLKMNASNALASSTHSATHYHFCSNKVIALLCYYGDEISMHMLVSNTGLINRLFVQVNRTLNTFTLQFFYFLITDRTGLRHRKTTSREHCGAQLHPPPPSIVRRTKSPREYFC